MTEIWLVRHGQTDWNVEGRYQGQQDVPLNATGLEQARDLAKKLEGKYFKALYSSDLSRARQTAEIIAEHIHLPVRQDRRLREIFQGEWEGLLFSEVSQRFPKLIEERFINPRHSRIPGGESIEEVSERVAGAMDDIARQHPPGPVLVVMHGLALATQVCRARKLPLENVFTLIPDNAEFHIVHFGDEA